MKAFLSLVLAVSNLSTVLLAAPFQNLDLEGYDRTTGLVPRWTFENDSILTVDGSKILTRLPLDLTVGLPFPINPPYATMYSAANKPFGFPADTGNYLLAVVPEIRVSDMSPWYIRQTGDIPSDAKSLSFDLGGAQVALKINGTEVALEFFSRPGFLAGWDFADVSAFAGQTVTMELTAPGRREDVLPFDVPGAPDPYTLLDNFQFSSEPIPPIPEPGTMALSAVGALLAFLNWRSSKTRR